MVHSIAVTVFSWLLKFSATCKMYFSDKSPLTVTAATLRQKLQIQLAISPSHGILKPGKPLQQGSHPSDHMENKDLLRTFLAFTRTLEGWTQLRASYLPVLYFRRLLRNKPEDKLLIWSATVFVSILSQRTLTTTDHSTRINILSTFKHLNFFYKDFTSICKDLLPKSKDL